MRGGRGDTASSHFDGTSRGGRSETTDESSNSDQSRRLHLSSLNSQAKRLKNKVLSSETSEDGDLERPMVRQTLRHRRKASAFIGSAVKPAIDSEGEPARSAPRSKSSVFLGNVLDEKKRELQSAVNGFKSKLQTPRKSIPAQSDALSEPKGGITKENISSVRPLLKKESRYRRKTSLYDAVMQQPTSTDSVAEENGSELHSAAPPKLGERAAEGNIIGNELKSNMFLSPVKSQSESSAESLKLDTKGLYHMSPRTTRWGMKSRINAPHVEQGLSRENVEDDATGSSLRVGILFGTGLNRGAHDEKKGKNFQSVLTELTSKIQTPRRAAGSCDCSSEPAFSKSDECEDSFAKQLKLARPKIGLRRKAHDLTSEAVFSADSSEIEKEFFTPKSENGNSNRAILEEKKREFQNVITELKAKIQVARRSEYFEPKPSLRVSLSEHSPVDQCLSDHESTSTDRTRLAACTFDEGGLLKPLRLGKSRKRGTTVDGLEKWKSSSETYICDGNGVEDVLTIAQDTFDVASNFFVKRILKKRIHEDGLLDSDPSSTDDIKAKDQEHQHSDLGEPENAKLTREICRLRERLVDLETEVQKLEEKLDLTENRIAAETSKMDVLVTSLNQAQELRYQHLMTVFNENYTMLGTLESQFEHVLSNNYNTHSSTASGRISKMAWLVVDAVCLVLVMIVGFITRSRSYFGRRQAIASRVSPHARKEDVGTHGRVQESRSSP